MSVLESILAASFCLTIVFIVLAGLYGLIRLFSLGIYAITKREQGTEAAKGEGDSNTMSDELLETMSEAMLEERYILSKESEAAEEFSAGSLKLIDVDERTAAMIMAIVSDESGIPLSELCFKSIKLIPKK